MSTSSPESSPRFVRASRSCRSVATTINERKCGRGIDRDSHPATRRPDRGPDRGHTQRYRGSAAAPGATRAPAPGATRCSVGEGRCPIQRSPDGLAALTKRLDYEESAAATARRPRLGPVASVSSWSPCQITWPPSRVSALPSLPQPSSPRPGRCKKSCRGCWRRPQHERSCHRRPPRDAAPCGRASGGPRSGPAGRWARRWLDHFRPGEELAQALDGQGHPETAPSKVFPTTGLGCHHAASLRGCSSSRRGEISFLEAGGRVLVRGVGSPHVSTKNIRASRELMLL